VVASSGNFTGSTSTGCNVSGSFVPRTAAKLVLNLTVNFDAATCGGSAFTVRGAAGYTVANGLVFAGTRADRSDAFFGVATKL
jgi:hypothetical protein